VNCGTVRQPIKKSVLPPKPAKAPCHRSFEFPTLARRVFPRTSNNGFSLAVACFPFARLLLNRHLNARTRFDAFIGGPRNHNAGLHEILQGQRGVALVGRSNGLWGMRNSNSRPAAAASKPSILSHCGRPWLIASRLFSLSLDEH
jgi:hypothetical protein